MKLFCDVHVCVHACMHVCVRMRKHAHARQGVHRFLFFLGGGGCAFVHLWVCFCFYRERGCFITTNIHVSKKGNSSFIHLSLMA